MGLGDDDALAQGQAVRLDDGGQRRGFEVRPGAVRVREHLAFRGGDAVLLHQFLGKHLAGLNAGGIFPGAEGGHACRLQRVHRTQGQRIIRGHHRKVDLVFNGKLHDAVNVLRADIHADSVLGDPAVPRQGVNGFRVRALFQRLDDGMLPPAGANDKNFHGGASLRFLKTFTAFLGR